VSLVGGHEHPQPHRGGLHQQPAPFRVNHRRGQRTRLANPCGGRRLVGYPESFTDPSFAGQILVKTYPFVGNYGVPNDEADEYGLPLHFEGAMIYPVVVDDNEYSFTALHYATTGSRAKWLQENSVTGIFSFDTRAIAKRTKDSPCESLRRTSAGNTTSSAASSTTSRVHLVVVPWGYDFANEEPSPGRSCHDLPPRRELRRAERQG